MRDARLAAGTSPEVRRGAKRARHALACSVPRAANPSPSTHTTATSHPPVDREDRRLRLCALEFSTRGYRVSPTVASTFHRTSPICQRLGATVGCPPCCNPNERNWALKWSSQKIQESRSIVPLGSDFRASNGWRCHNWAYRASGALKVRCFRAFLGGARARCSSVAARTAVTGVHRASFNGRITAKTRVEEVTDTKPILREEGLNACAPSIRHTNTITNFIMTTMTKNHSTLIISIFF